MQTIVEQLSNDTHVDGILVQLPLPPGLKEEVVLQDISPVKDVDGGALTALSVVCQCRLCLQRCCLCSRAVEYCRSPLSICLRSFAGLSPINVGRMLMRGVLPTYSPCPALACIELLKRSDIPIHNKKVSLASSAEPY